MGFRTIVIGQAAELHIKCGQLEITTGDWIFLVPVEDVDLIANDIIGSNTILSKTERREITRVLHNACIIDNTKVNVMSAINIMIESLKRIILSETHEELKLPLILPIENMEGITE